MRAPWGKVSGICDAISIRTVVLRGARRSCPPGHCRSRLAGTLRRHVTRLSSYFLPTEREPPADAEAISHKLMVRAGLIRQVGSGLWSYLPAGWRVHEKASQIIREELDRIGGYEKLLSG